MRRTVDPKLGFFLATLSVGVALDVIGCSSNEGGISDESGGKSARGGAAGSAGIHTQAGMRSGGATSKGGSTAEAGAAIGGDGPMEGGAPGEMPGFGGTPGLGGTRNEGGGATREACVYHTESPLAAEPVSTGGAGSNGGSSSTAGTGTNGGADANGGTPGATAGTSATSGTNGMAGTNAMAGSSGSAGGGASGTAGSSAKGGTSSTAGTSTSGGVARGTGGGGGAPPITAVTLQKSAFVGTYLADSSGKALYVYGADQPGDCNYEPVTHCFKDCLIAWPIFDAAPRTLPPGIDDGLFGTITRPDGPTQTTYMGWPLYYYKSDLAPGDVKGQAVGKIWHLAEVILPNVVILRMADPITPTTSLKFLASETGQTLYTFGEDTVGTKASHPVSACTGPCLDQFQPFLLDYLSPVSYLEPSDFTYFVRSDGASQIAYKGAPLYFASADLRSGDMNGQATTGWSLAAP